MVEITVEEAHGRVSVLAGAGGYNTAEVISLVRELAALGVDGYLSVTPYYNKPTQEGLYQHFKAIAASTPLPIILYSVQGRTGINIEPATVARLAQVPNIVGIKEASGNISQMAAILNQVADDFLVLSGDDAIALALSTPTLGVGCHVVLVDGEPVLSPREQIPWLADPDFAAKARTG